jgi:hypothetical protein
VVSFTLPHRTVHTGTRRGISLAQGFESLVRDARQPRHYLSAAAPFREEAVREAAPELLDLAAVLRTKEDPAPCGIALARRLLTDPASLVYSDTGEDLRAKALAARMSLQEDLH